MVGPVFIVWTWNDKGILKSLGKSQGLVEAGLLETITVPGSNPATAVQSIGQWQWPVLCTSMNQVHVYL